MEFHPFPRTLQGLINKQAQKEREMCNRKKKDILPLLHYVRKAASSPPSSLTLLGCASPTRPTAALGRRSARAREGDARSVIVN